MSQKSIKRIQGANLSYFFEAYAHIVSRLSVEEDGVFEI